jgi:hypothetical protein
VTNVNLTRVILLGAGQNSLNGEDGGEEGGEESVSRYFLAHLTVNVPVPYLPHSW